MKLLALDISLRSTGWAVWDTDSDTEAVRVGAINPKTFGLDRYRFILSALGEVNAQDGPFDFVVMEGYPFFLFGKEKRSGKLVRTDAGQGPGNQVFGLAEITGLIKMMVHFRWGLPFACIAPTSIKKYATNFGRADKTMMIAQLAEEHGLRFRTNDEVDAWYIGQLATDIVNFVANESIPLVANRKEVVTGTVQSNNPEGTLDWTTLTWHDKQFGRKKFKVRKIRRRR